VQASNVGSYAINGSGLTANNGNYSFVQTAGNATALTITPAPPPLAPTALPVTTDLASQTVTPNPAINIPSINIPSISAVNIPTSALVPFGSIADNTGLFTSGMGSMGADFLVQTSASGSAVEPFTSGAGSYLEAQASASGPDSEPFTTDIEWTTAWQRLSELPDSEPFTTDIEWTTAWQRLSELDAPLVSCKHMFGMPATLNTAKALSQTTVIPSLSGERVRAQSQCL
jgi:hypothetical protein